MIVHLDYLIPAGGRISDLSSVKLEHASTGGGFEGRVILMMLMMYFFDSVNWISLFCKLHFSYSKSNLSNRINLAQPEKKGEKQ